MRLGLKFRSQHHKRSWQNLSIPPLSVCVVCETKRFIHIKIFMTLQMSWTFNGGEIWIFFYVTTPDLNNALQRLCMAQSTNLKVQLKDTQLIRSSLYDYLLTSIFRQNGILLSITIQFRSKFVNSQRTSVLNERKWWQQLKNWSEQSISL